MDKELVNKLAEKVHKRWMQGRLDDGWNYGPERDDEKKQHPCLIPYNELPESEKEYDRATARETIETLKSLGYKIEKKADL